MWIWLVLLYGILKGVREIVKKKALQQNSTIEVLFMYTFLSFAMVFPTVKQAMGLEPRFYLYIAMKSLVIFLAWMFSFRAIKKMPISLYGVLDLSRVLFATLLGVIVLQEVLGVYQMIGLLLVSAGLLLLKYRPRSLRGADASAGEAVETKIVVMAFASCLLNAVSGLLDKLLMRDINSSQLQFWYLLFLTLFYLAFILLTRMPVNWKRAVCNKWVWLLSLLIVIADRALFVANGMEGSRVTVMTLLKQAGCVVTILAGRYLFKEKGAAHKMVCAAVIIAGIVLGAAA
ncbi:MAG: EamA family transporter [Bacteroidales bacterium]|nr:EamA family transporter [Bacteroidales bacterium]MCM1416000.1 EamA family transporter [bacterium]MCM1424279.1 EamA family transporter [bacterium]